MLKVGTIEYSNTYNAFLDIFIDFNDFINNLVITNVDFSNNNEYGSITYNPENFTEFSYIYLDNTFIITNYSKFSRSNYYPS